MKKIINRSANYRYCVLRTVRLLTKTRLGGCVKNLRVRVRLRSLESLVGLGLCVIVATMVRRNTDWL